ncbi:uncharacterized protein LOC111705166 [Eurytemora carolleeae]|uniref:uncharacterized protein LOC111705166 n=1 Tax=Eurytemora carolleeae TaxID=1294199 RepID=UPI000C77C9A8|nr:uncharacterized protein LOC111705166 [Eurytemora carolleeae]XP_023333515.1 uncharacterized protein LOC111705166 [Eurytemora carolleeae]XP_023333580.1 uncharacterized protein LOC111705166 [Eurytemora carolleeae]|eukprot:XP_023333435.1 uncharacterized protein LOC111705166 [Eurytemora affinis]
MFIQFFSCIALAAVTISQPIQVDEEGLRLDNFLNPSLVEDNVLPENHPLASLVLTDDFEEKVAQFVSNRYPEEEREYQTERLLQTLQNIREQILQEMNWRENERDRRVRML